MYKLAGLFFWYITAARATRYDIINLNFLTVFKLMKLKVLSLYDFHENTTYKRGFCKYFQQKSKPRYFHFYFIASIVYCPYDKTCSDFVMKSRDAKLLFEISILLYLNN